MGTALGPAITILVYRFEEGPGAGTSMAGRALEATPVSSACVAASAAEPTCCLEFKLSCPAACRSEIFAVYNCSHEAIRLEGGPRLLRPLSSAPWQGPGETPAGTGALPATTRRPRTS